jgi:Sodium/hydrogen exchanger family
MTGLALPFVVIFLATAKHEHSDLLRVGLDLLIGLIFGFAVTALVALAWRTKILTSEPHLQPLGAVAIAVVVYAGCHLTHGNPYLAAFAAGSTLATLDDVTATQFKPFGDLLSEITKFVALLVFGALITPERLSHLGWVDWLLAIVIIVVVRPVVMLVSLLSSQLAWDERLAAAWFGPKDSRRWCMACWRWNPELPPTNWFSISSRSPSPYRSCCIRPLTCRSPGCCASTRPKTCPAAAPSSRQKPITHARDHIACSDNSGRIDRVHIYGVLR